MLRLNVTPGSASLKLHTALIFDGAMRHTRRLWAKTSIQKWAKARLLET